MLQSIPVKRIQRIFNAALECDLLIEISAIVRDHLVEYVGRCW